MAPAITDLPASPSPTQEPHSVPNALSLAGKTIVVTGGGRGLGVFLAQAVIESGGHVVCLDILPAPLEPGWSDLLKLCKKNNLTASFYRCDITDEAGMATIIDTIVHAADERGAPFSGIVACAGIQQKVPAIEYDPAAFDRVLRVNVTGTFITAKLAARALVQSKRSGSIVLVASMSGQIANRVWKLITHMLSSTKHYRALLARLIIQANRLCIKCVARWRRNGASMESALILSHLGYVVSCWHKIDGTNASNIVRVDRYDERATRDGARGAAEVHGGCALGETRNARGLQGSHCFPSIRG